MCENDSSSLKVALNYRCYASEEQNNCKYMNGISNKKMLPVTTSNVEMLPFLQSTMPNKTESPASSSLAYDVDVVNVNGNSSSNNSMTSLKSNTSSTSSAPQTSTSIGVNLRVTGQCSQGGRKYMEDYFSVAYQQSENANDLEYAFVGIYDGHGGAEAATFAKEHLMMEIINQKLFWSDSDQDVLRAIREGYIATHYAMWRDQENWPKTATGLPSTAGTTATVAFIRREKIYIGHVGDSGIVLGYQNDNEHFWRAKPLTTDHKPESLVERTRIMRSGGKVVVKSGVPRVVWSRPRTAGHKGPIRHNTLVDEIPFLAVARSLGDLWSYNSESNEFVVSPDPDVKVIKINPKTFRCLVFGTDGLWNVVSPQEAVDCVYEKEKINERLQAQRGESPAEGDCGQWTNPSKGLVNKALKTWAAKKMRADNTSVVTVILYPPGMTVEDKAPSCHTQSYGLEYTQVNAEILMHDDSTTYAELATKYTPPEEYRNFKYDDDEPQETNVGPLNAQYESYAAHVYPAFEPNMISTANDCYHALVTPQLSCEKAVAAEAGNEDDVDDLEDEDCEEDSDNNDGCTGDGEAEALTSVITYAAEGLSHCSLEHSVPASKDTLPPKLMEPESLDYMNSFAESYTDSLLGSEGTIVNPNVNALSSASLCNNSDSHCSDSTSSSSSSSSASFHSAVYQHNQELQHELLREHQLYQAQCMSQEEGYSLTKLETRGEQQMRNGTSATTGSSSRAVAGKEVQTFQIFQQPNETITDSYPESNAAVRSSTTYNNDASRRENVWDSRCPALCRFINSYETPKLELNSLLQQEMEEEQQVAMERLAMQHHVEQLAHQNTVEVPEGSICAEYLEEELITESADIDTSIQIHEISSSMESPTTSAEMEVDVLVEDEEMAEDVVVPDEVPHQHPGSSKNTIVLIEKIEILKDKPELVIECAPSTSFSSTSLPLQPPTLRSRLPRSKPPYSSASVSKPPIKALINPSPSKRQHFPNVPNENQRLSLPSCSRTLRHCTSSAYASMLHQRTEYRQLRSMAPPNVVDYSKRTLRSRNSLSKDMKAKATLNLRRSTSLTNQYMRTTAATLLAPNATQQQPTQLQQRQNATHQTSVSHLPIAVRKTKSATATAVASNITPSSCGINLRSRQIVSHVSPVTSATSVASSTSIHHLQQRREKRNLRSLSSKAVTTNSRRNCKESNSTGSFSKATRLQSTAANLAAPPPSPKLICIAKRARSLLPPQIVPADFGKRSSLRSGSTLINAKTATAAVSSALQTRSRVQKHINR